VVRGRRAIAIPAGPTMTSITGPDPAAGWMDGC
jgi:hypothetical protein